MKSTNLKPLMMFYLFLSLILACTKSDTPAEEISGSWNLVKVRGTIAGIEQDYPIGDIIWTFDNGNIIVRNNYTGQWNVSMTSGTYPYTIDTSKNNLLEVKSEYFGNYDIKKDTLNITQSLISDGIDFTFIR